MTVAPPIDVFYLDEVLLRPDGRLELLPASAYERIDPLHLRVWCHREARYCLPTIELVQWLKDRIGTRSAIEICSGNGDLAFHLGIPATDSYQQICDPMTIAYYRALNQPPTRPSSDVLKLDARAAIEHFRPQVVIGAWVTQKCYVQDRVGDGNKDGPEERRILDVASYIHVGNDRVHSSKRICGRRHEVFHFPWLKSRAERPQLNAIYVWERS